MKVVQTYTRVVAFMISMVRVGGLCVGSCVTGPGGICSCRPSSYVTG